MTWATSVPILVFLGLSVLNLGPRYATDRQTDRQTDVRQKHRLMPPPNGGGGIINKASTSLSVFITDVRRASSLNVPALGDCE